MRVVGQFVIAVAMLWASFALSSQAVAQECPPATPGTDDTSLTAPCVTDRNFDTYRPLATATRIDASQSPPIIDGDISDPVWAQAAIIEEFYQVEPEDGATPTQRTRAYITYDRRNLYVAIYSYDTDPDLIRANQMKRDPRLQDDDAVRLLIDSYGTFRDSFFFGLNPNGARSDALTENGNSFRQEWNTIWRGDAKVVEDGWIAEFAIPFQSFSFDPSLDEWNLQIIRTVRRNNEEIRWSNINQSRGRIDMTSPGRLAGINDVSSGIGLEAQVFLTGAASRDWVLDDTDFDLNPSGNVFYKITPSLTGSLTFNTDFSDTGLDARQVNTGRFSLFFPETRDFFLQDASVFEFGGRVFGDRPNGLPFFSRNIGIVNGVPVDIVAGAKLSGKLGPANVGMISARTGSADSIGVDGQYLSSARISVPVLAESKAGIVFTNGDPDGGTNNTVAGADFQYKKSNVFGDGTFFADIAHVRSYTDGVEDDMTGAEIAYRSEKWNGTLRLRDIGENYSPQLGFSNRTGIRRYTMNFWRRYRPQNSFIRFAETGVWNNIITDLNDRKIDHFYGGWAGGMNNAGDEAWLNYEHGFVEISEPFSIAGIVPVPVGEYRWNQYSLRVQTTGARMIGVEGRVQFGGVFGGDLLELEGEISFRPNKHIELEFEHEYLEFDLPGGEIGIHISSIDSTIAFTPDMSIKTEIQYDNISEAFTFFSRFSWEPVPEREIFLSFGHTAIIDRIDFPRDFTSQSSSLALRLGHTFRM